MTSNLDKETRLQLLQEIYNIERLESMDLLQKARIKWDVEGDEDTNFFMLIKQQRRRQAIQGIILDGMWCSDPVQVKDVFFDFYKDKFQCHVPQVTCTDHSSFLTLSDSDRSELERGVSIKEIKKAVWDCESDKAPGPNGFSFQFLKRYWDIFKDDVESFVSYCFATSRLPPCTNSSFITLIPKGLHVAIRDANQVNLIKGVSVGNPCIHLTHLFYADDVVLVTEWSHVVMKNIIRLFNVFFAFGLRINIHKSNVYRIGVSNDEIEDMA
nr:RNA-directed DNA polymerase, eukaryota [Tanacetum cinerariifolium]